MYECNFTRENYGGMCAVKKAKIKSRSQEVSLGPFDGNVFFLEKVRFLAVRFTAASKNLSFN